VKKEKFGSSSKGKIFLYSQGREIGDEQRQSLGRGWRKEKKTLPSPPSERKTKEGPERKFGQKILPGWGGWDNLENDKRARKGTLDMQKSGLIKSEGDERRWKGLITTTERPIVVTSRTPGIAAKIKRNRMNRRRKKIR